MAAALYILMISLHYSCKALQSEQIAIVKIYIDQPSTTYLEYLGADMMRFNKHPLQQHVAPQL